MIRESQLQAGSQTFRGPRQIYRPRPVILATNTGGEASFTTTVKLPVPAGNAKIKLSVIYVPTAGKPLPDFANLCSIWVAAADEDQGGAGGGGGALIPVTDVDGSKGTPTTFPAANGLGGYSRSFVTSADWLQAVVTLLSIGGSTGTWVLQTSIQPAEAYFPWPAWEQIRGLFVPVNLGGIGSL